MLLPTFGKPTSPTSAMSFSSSLTSRVSPSRPFCAYSGAWLIELLKCTLPSPPLPPFKNSSRCPSLVKSQSSSPVWASSTAVPGGTMRSRCSPLLPCILRPVPASPFCARMAFLPLYAASVCVLLSATKYTSPPSPPSPPSGPPKMTCFSRRKLTDPAPP